MLSRSKSLNLGRLREAVNKLREEAEIISPPVRRDSGIGSPTVSEAPEIDPLDALLLQIVETARRFEALLVDSRELGEKNRGLVAQCDKPLQEKRAESERAEECERKLSESKNDGTVTKFPVLVGKTKAEKLKKALERTSKTHEEYVALYRGPGEWEQQLEPGELNDLGPEKSKTTEETDVVRLRAIISSKTQELGAMDTKLDRMKRLMEAEERRCNIEKERHEETKSKLAALELQQEQYLVRLQHMDRMETRLQTLVGPTPTPRSILLSIVVESHTRSVRLPNPPDKEVLPEKYSGNDLTYDQLNVFLNLDKVHQFLDNISALSGRNQIRNSLCLRVCALCNEPNFAPAPGQSYNNCKLSEFPRCSGQTKRCISAICVRCWERFFHNAIQNNWWHNLESSRWLRCPLPSCRHSLKISPGAQLSMQLSGLDGIDIKNSVEMFEIGNILHSELRNLDPRPSPRALEAARLLHSRQVEYGHMYSFFDKRFKESEPDGNRRVQLYEPGIVAVGKLDAGNLEIPIFTKAFRRSNEPRECSLCAESYYDINFKGEEKWEESCFGFEGSWMWKPLLFPTKKMLKCRHDVTACKECHRKHLAAQLEVKGRIGCDQLSCAECNRILEHNEVQALASEETAKMLDNYKFLNHISTEPHFRWCLREGCTNGELYESGDSLIMCSACGYQMCFGHQTAWHVALNCAEYENLRRHGDPNIQGTQDEIRRATRACPGPDCGVRIQKNDGCSHMRCTSCDVHFCWTCMGVWPRGTAYDYQHSCQTR